MLQFICGVSHVSSTYKRFVEKLQTLKDATPWMALKIKKIVLDCVTAKLDQMPKEYHVTLHGFWKKSLMETICKQHSLRTYRYPKQKNTTIMIWVSATYMDTAS